MSEKQLQRLTELLDNPEFQKLGGKSIAPTLLCHACCTCLKASCKRWPQPCEAAAQVLQSIRGNYGYV